MVGRAMRQVEVQAREVEEAEENCLVCGGVVGMEVRFYTVVLGVQQFALSGTLVGIIYALSMSLLCNGPQWFLMSGGRNGCSSLCT